MKKGTHYLSPPPDLKSNSLHLHITQEGVSRLCGSQQLLVLSNTRVHGMASVWLPFAFNKSLELTVNWTI